MIFESPGFNPLSAIACGDDGTVWFGTWDGFLRWYDGKTVNEFGSLGNSRITAITFDQAGNKWIGTSENGLYYLAGKNITHYSSQDGLAGYYIESINIDKNNTKWIGFGRMGSGNDESSGGIMSIADHPLGVYGSTVSRIVPVVSGVYPNPFNSKVTISFNLPFNNPASLAVYSLTGQRIRSLISRSFPAGAHSIVWDGRDDSGRPVSSGVYIARLVSGRSSSTRKLLLMK